MTDFVRYEHTHLPGIIALCEAEGWPSFPDDPARAGRVLTAPGVTTVVAIVDGEVVGFAQMQSDGEIQAHLSSIAVKETHRRRGIALGLVKQSFEWAGGERVDLVTDSADAFYAANPHRRLSGFRIWP